MIRQNDMPLNTIVFSQRAIIYPTRKHTILLKILGLSSFRFQNLIWKEISEEHYIGTLQDSSEEEIYFQKTWKFSNTVFWFDHDFQVNGSWYVHRDHVCNSYICSVDWKNCNK